MGRWCSCAEPKTRGIAHRRCLKCGKLIRGRRIDDEKYRREKADADVAMEGLSSTEMLAYEFIRDAEQPLPIRDMPHQLQGAVGRLTSKGVIERYRTQAEITKHGFTSMKMTNCVRVKQ